MLTEDREPSAALPLARLGISVPVSAIYDGVELEAGGSGQLVEGGEEGFVRLGGNRPQGHSGGMVPEPPAEGEVVFGDATVGFQVHLAAGLARGDDRSFFVVTEGVELAGKPELADERRGDGVEFVVFQGSTGQFEPVVDQALVETITSNRTP